MDVDVRVNKTALKFETRTNAVGDTENWVSGRAIPFDSRSVDMGFTEVIKPEAVDRVLREQSDMMLLHNHDMSQLLARTSNNSMSVEKREDGLYFSARLIPTSMAQDVIMMLGEDLLRAMSFGFRAAKDTWSFENGQDVRTIEEFDYLPELSIVADPAYPESFALAQRSREQAKKSKPTPTNELNREVRLRIERLEQQARLTTIRGRL